MYVMNFQQLASFFIKNFVCDGRCKCFVASYIGYDLEVYNFKEKSWDYRACMPNEDGYYDHCMWFNVTTPKKKGSVCYKFAGNKESHEPEDEKTFVRTIYNEAFNDSSINWTLEWDLPR
jgi:hypothetical protein